MAPSSKRSPTQGDMDQPQAAKQARKEAAASQGFIPPPLIDEVTEL
jgi:hypothetical protein